MITASQLVAAGVGPTQANAFAAPLAAACDRFDIVTPRRLAAFIGQCMVESDCFVHLEENCFYSNPSRLADVFPHEFSTGVQAVAFCRNPQKLASHVYAGRGGNGDEASCDGWAYRGRGLIQMTFRAAYADASQALGRDYIAVPDLVALPEDACLTSAWWWHSHKLNVLADAGLIDAITKVVNPGLLSAALRRQYTQQTLAALSL